MKNCRISEDLCISHLHSKTTPPLLEIYSLSPEYSLSLAPNCCLSWKITEWNRVKMLCWFILMKFSKDLRQFERETRALASHLGELIKYQTLRFQLNSCEPTHTKPIFISPISPISLLSVYLSISVSAITKTNLKAWSNGICCLCSLATSSGIRCSASNWQSGWHAIVTSKFQLEINKKKICVEIG